MKNIILTISIVVLLASPLLADSITLTTYYPAPFGMYQELRAMGRLGVGTTNPASRVHIVGEGSTDATSSLHVQNANLNSILFTRDDGNVGIGTSAPGRRLHLQGQTDVVVGVENTTGNTSALLLRAQDGITTLDSRVSNNDNNARPFRIVTGNTERVRIDNNGNVGIGTTAPLLKLDVRDSTQGAGTHRILIGKSFTDTAVDRTAGIILGGSDENAQPGKQFNIDVSSSQNWFNSPVLSMYWGSNANKNNFVINHSGEVGIGTTAPNAALQVMGSIKKGNQEVLTQQDLTIPIFVNNKQCEPALPVTALTTKQYCAGGTPGSCSNKPGASCSDLSGDEGMCLGTDDCRWNLHAEVCFGTLKCENMNIKLWCDSSPIACVWNTGSAPDQNTPIGRMYPY